jgi:hypothetical protein
VSRVGGRFALATALSHSVEIPSPFLLTEEAYLSLTAEPVAALGTDVLVPPPNPG